MSGDRGQLRAMWLLPFAAAADKACLTFKCQTSHERAGREHRRDIAFWYCTEAARHFPSTASLRGAWDGRLGTVACLKRVDVNLAVLADAPARPCYAQHRGLAGQGYSKHARHRFAWV